MIGLTHAQRKVLDFLRAYIGQHGHSPSYEEIRVGCWLRSVSIVFQRLNALEDRGHIVRKWTGLGNARRRSITLLDPPIVIRGEPYRFIPKTHASDSVRAFRFPRRRPSPASSPPAVPADVTCGSAAGGVGES